MDDPDIADLDMWSLVLAGLHNDEPGARITMADMDPAEVRRRLARVVAGLAGQVAFMMSGRDGAVTADGVLDLYRGPAGPAVAGSGR